jgi:molybdate transport repressor ModE-like protein
MTVHKGPSIEFDVSWLAGEGLPREHGRMLTQLLDALSATTSLQGAARKLGVSYRYAWGLLGEGARALGAPLVEMARGRGARLTPLGRKVLEADAHVRTTLGAPFERLRGELGALLGEALPRRRPRLALRASHDLALAELARLCGAQLELEIEIRGADDSLAALARGQCDLAGFHVADALPRAAAAAAALGRWLDPRTHQLVNFVVREQGLIVRPGARIRGVHDLARPGVRFVDRAPPGSGRDGANADLQVAAAVAEGRADAGFGLRAAAAQMRLDFVPLATERYFLAAARRTLRSAAGQSLMQVLRSAEFSRSVARLPGYDASHAGAHESLAAALSWIGRAGRRKAVREHA